MRQCLSNMWWRVRWARLLRDHPEPQPNLVERLLYALDRVGRPNVALGVVTGGGKPFLARERGLLLVSPELGALLTDDELAAMVRYFLIAPPGANRRIPGAGATRKLFEAYLAEGGAALPYIRAQVKLYGGALPNRVRAHLQQVAEVAGVAPHTLARCIQETVFPTGGAI